MESIKKKDRDHLTWLSSHKGSSRKVYERAWNFWQRYLGDKNEEWIKANKDTEDWATHLIQYRRWLQTQRSKKHPERFLSDNSAKALTMAIRSYFKHIGIAVDLTKGQKEEIRQVSYKPEIDYPFKLRTKELLLQAVDNPIEEYIVSAGISFGLRINDFLKLTRGILEPLVNEDAEPPIALPPIPTQKRGVTAYPYIDKDALPAIRKLLKEMDKAGRTDPDEPMLLISTHKVNDLLQDLFNRAGIKTGTYQIRYHVLRKFLADQLAGICSSDKWKNFIGKSATSPYVSSEGKEIYKRVMSFTCINETRVGQKGIMISKEEHQLLMVLKQAMSMYDTMKAQVVRSGFDMEPSIAQYAEDVNSPLLDAVLLARAFREALKKEA